MPCCDIRSPRENCHQFPCLSFGCTPLSILMFPSFRNLQLPVYHAFVAKKRVARIPNRRRVPAQDLQESPRKFPDADAPAARFSNSVLWATIFCAILAAYLPALHGGLLWDDSSHITRPELQSLHGLWRIWFDLRATQQYYPLLHSAFWLEHRLWGDTVVGYHLTNIALHASS